MAKGLVVPYGPPGGGKSTESLKAFQKSLYVASAPNNAHFFKVWLKSPEGQAAGLALPHREFVYDVYANIDSWDPNKDAKGEPIPQIQVGANGLPVPLSTKLRLEQTLHAIATKALAERAAGQPPSYQNLIIDEAGTFWARVFEEIVPTCLTNAGKTDTRAAYGVLASWSRYMVDLMRAVLMAGMNVCLVAHDGDPDPGTGKKGGPKFPSKAIMGELCAAADIVAMREVEDRTAQVNRGANVDPGALVIAPKSEGPRRIWLVHASQNWLSKIRGVPDSMFEQVKDMEFADLIRLGGYEP